VVGYWHDTGHAGTHERLGFTTQAEWLKRYADRMIGIHLHDINVERDHQCPGNGSIDWARCGTAVPDSALRGVRDRRVERTRVSQRLPIDHEWTSDSSA
jgi:sugar phosphate isomerase/epimerase